MPNGHPLPVARAANALFDRLLGVFPVVVVTGARQTGKTTLVMMHPALRERQHFNLDDAATRAAALSDPALFARQAPAMAIDEVQRAPELMLAIKGEVDREFQATKGRFVLTGSANLLMMKQVSDSLAGRAIYLRLGPMTRREQIGLAATGRWDLFFTESLEKWRDALESDPPLAEPWADAVTRGGLPVPALHIGAEARTDWFTSYISTYIDRDLRDLSTVELLPDFRQAMRALALRIGSPVNQTEIARDLNIQQRNLSRWMNLLETSWLLARVPAFSVNRTSRLMRRPKIYWLDSALAMHLAGETQPRGPHLENLVFSDLQAWAALQSRLTQVLYWRTTDNAEVDFVVETGQQRLAVEVKATSRPGFSDARHLKRFVEEYPDTCVGALLLHDGDQVLRFGERILAVPWWRVI